MAAQDYTLFCRHLNCACRGALTMFFLVSIIVLIINMRKHRGLSVVYAKRLSLIAMFIELAANSSHMIINVVTHLSPLYDLPLHNVVYALVEMIVMVLTGMSVIALVRLKHMSHIHTFLLFVPLIVSIVGYVLTAQHIYFNIAIYYVILYCIMLVVLAVIMVRKYNEMIRQTFSNTSPYAVQWVYFIVVAYVALFALWSIQTFFNHELWVKCVCLVLNMVPWVIYMHFILRVRPVDDYVKDLIDGDDDGKAPQVKTWQWAGFGDSINAYCMREEVFGNTELTIMDVARAVGTNRTYISRWCREQGLDFSSYIRRIRLDFAVDLLLHTDLTMDQIATKAGFYTPRSFRVAFMARYGCTPRDYVLTHLHEK